MTILNTIVLPDRVGFLADSSVSGDPAGPTITAKVVALPGLGLIVGAAGSLAVLQEVVRLLLGGLPPESTAADVAHELGETLLGIWQRAGRHPTSIVLAGTDGPTARAFILQSPTFEALELPPGVWLQPGTEAAPPTQTTPSDEPPPRCELPRQAEPWPHGWSVSLEVARAAFRQQREQRRTPSGGSADLVMLDAFNGIHAQRLEALEFHEATPA